MARNYTMKDGKLIEFSKLEWSTTSFKVSDFLTKFTLPQVVKVIEGFYGEDEDSSFGADQILSLHCVKSTDKVAGRDFRGKEVNIPLHCQNKVEVRPSDMKDVYETVDELCAAFPRYVRISQGYYSASTDEEILNVGDKLQLRGVDKSKKGEEKLICVNQNGQTIELPKDCVAGFHPLADGKEYFLAEISAHFPMPVYVQFIDPPCMGKQSRSADASFFNSSLGVIYLENSYTENIIIASTISQDGQRTVVTFPREIDIRLAVCEGMQQNTAAYAEICEALNHGMHLSNLTLIDMFSAFKPRNSVREFSYKELTNPTCTSGFEKDASPYAEISDPVANNPGQIVKDQKPETHVSKQEVDGENPEAVIQKREAAGQKPEEVDNCPDDYENWAPEPEKGQREGKKGPLKPQRSEQSLQTSLQDMANSSEQQVTKSYKSVSSQTHQENGVSETKSNINGSYNKHMDISHYSVKQVSEILKELAMDRYIAKFESEKIDGQMLMCLDDDILVADFGMNNLHCLKLKKYLEGWRPKA